MRYFDDLLALFFPRICPACGNSLWKHENCICTSCEYYLPETGFHKDPGNPVTDLFTGRVNTEAAAAWLYYSKGGRVQRLIHALKYKGRKDIGVHMGFLYGQALKDAAGFNNAITVVPVPLHKKKYMKRGYNQSEQIAIGIGKAMNIPVDRHLLLRYRATDTQTRRSRYDRHLNVENVFRVPFPEKHAGMHLLLVDDVVTTGSTLESCILALGAIPDVKVSVACLASSVL